MFFLPIIPIYTKNPDKLNEIINNNYCGVNDKSFFISICNKFNNIIVGGSEGYTHYLLGVIDKKTTNNNDLLFVVKKPKSEDVITIKPLIIYKTPYIGKKAEQLISKIFNFGKKHIVIGLFAYLLAFIIYNVWLLTFTIYGWWLFMITNIKPHSSIME